jgi:hypothetical protein
MAKDFTNHANTLGLHPNSSVSQLQGYEHPKDGLLFWKVLVLLCRECSGRGSGQAPYEGDREPS